MRSFVTGKRLLLVLSFGATVFAQSPTPKQAWETMKRHAADVQNCYDTKDGDFVTLQEIMRHAGPNFAQSQKDFVALRTKISIDHRSSAMTLFRPGGGGAFNSTLYWAQQDFGELDRLSARFVELAKQMVDRRTPQSEREFRNYLAIFSGKIGDLDKLHFWPLSQRVSAFVADCAFHADMNKRFNDPVRRSIDTFYSDSRYAKARADYQAQRERLFRYLADWDARQPEVVAAGQVLNNDWRRIHEDTARLAAFVSSPTFVKDLPDLDAATVVDSIARIRGYLETYR